MSFLTNPSAQTATSWLRTGQTDQNRLLGSISSGKDVSTASGNAAYWSIAKMMNSAAMSNNATQDAIGFSQAITDVTAMGLDAARELVSDIRSKLVMATALNTGREKVNTEINQLKSQLKSVAEASGFGGENWLNLGAGETAGTKSLVSSVTRDSDGNVEVNSIDFDTEGTALISEDDPSAGILTATQDVNTPAGNAYSFHLLGDGDGTSASISVTNATSKDEIKGMIQATDQILSALTDAGAKVGATQSTLDAQNNFLSDLTDAIRRGTGKLVDSNMEEDAAKLSATKVQGELRTQMLNIANTSNQSTLQLFR